MTAVSRTWWVLLGCLVAAAGPAPATATAAATAAAGGQAPALPAATSSCVGPSPITVDDIPWAVRRIAPAAIWPLTRGSGVLVAVVDTGVSGAAPALRGAVRRGTDVVAGGPADRDCLGRGTALAGIVAARPARGSGLVGVAPDAAVLPVRITDRRGQIPPGALAAGIRTAAAAGADVILVGTGTTTPDAALASAVADAGAHDALVVASVSDQQPPDGGPVTPPWYPAAYSSVVAVTGVDPGGTPTGTVSTATGVDLTAPGGGTVGPAPVGGGHYRVAGSPVAAAYVAGAAALVRAYHPDLDAAAVRDRLELTAEQPTGGARTAEGGTGLLDAYAAVAGLAPHQRDQPVPGTAAPPALPVVAPRSRAPLVAGLVAVCAAVAAGLSCTVAGTLRQGRRRRWRP